MKNAKAFVLVSLLSVAGLAQADACCQETSTVVAQEVSFSADSADKAQAKKPTDDKAVVDADQETKEVAGVDKE